MQLQCTYSVVPHWSWQCMAVYFLAKALREALLHTFFLTGLCIYNGFVLFRKHQDYSTY